MSIPEIIDELPKLTHHERRELCRKIVEIESHGEDIDLCDEAAREGFAMLDRMEAQHALRA
jgi:transcription elongation GreA/GreB family factor